MLKKNGCKGKSWQVFGLVVLIMGVTLGLAGCSPKEEAPEAEKGIAVETETVIPRDIASSTVLKGNIAAEDEVSLIPKASGTVSAVRVKMGDQVSAGDVICVIDSKDMQAQLQQAQASYNTALSGYNEAVANKKRMQILYDEGAVSLQQLEQATGAVERSGLDSAAAAVKMAQDQINNCVVTATISGTIASCDVQVGAMVGPQTPVVRIVTVKNVKVLADITESNINKIKVGQKVQVLISAAGDTPFEATIKTIAPAANPQTMTFPVEMIIANPNGIIKPGMFGEATIDTRRSQGVVSISKKALSTEDTVFVVKDNVATLVPVETGVEDEYYIQITGGLAGGETIVSNGQHLLYDGAVIRDVTNKDQSPATDKAVDDGIVK